ncbi:putative Xaa-Pro aminopeptidase [Lasiodiplodia theobromae]|uniref:Xaa-Pro aminopeptidase n=1 Tax=Lasiodiplodia theobromae TaxID=45133 RepID=A0A5N5D1X9_9PEZI|nr:putative Xaa-Pro aminopeptidase [Lasiodiplodia theobromae]
MEHPDFRLHLGAGSPLEKYPAKQHARRVADFLGVAKGLIYLPGAPTAYLEDSDQFVPFRQRRYFYYLTGVDEADCHLTYDIRLDFLTLYVPSPGSPRKVYYNGRGSTPEEALDKYDVDAVDFSYAVPGYVEFWMTQHEGDVYILHPDQAVVPGHDKSPRVNYTKLQVAIDAARVRKDQHEIKLIRKANQVSAKAHEKVLRNIRAFKNEAQVEATFLDTCVAADAKHQAYEIIAASGENAATLHYIKNDEPFHDRPLMCLDAGCEWQCYASDVTRTFPLTGQWPSKESKAIYDLVLKMQTECIDAIRPGARYLDIHYLAHRILIDGLLELGILHNGTPEDIFDAGTSLAFLPHGLGHHLGLEVHDVSDVPLMAGTAEHMSSVVDPEMCKALVHPNHPALEEGMVITVEPGIYFNRYALNAVYLSSPIHSRYINRRVLQRYLPVGGVRIEDDILVTHDGYENLTTAPKGEEMLRIMQDGCVETLDGETPRKRQRRASATKVRKEIHQDSVTKSKGIEAWSQDVTAGPPEPFRKSPESTTASNVVELEGSQASPQTPKRSVPASLAAAPASFEAYDWPIHEGAIAAELPSEPERNSEIQVPGESQASHWRKVPSALARMASTRSLSSHSLPEYSPSQMFQRPRQAPMPPQKLPELPAKPLAYRQSMPIIISGSQAVKPLPYRPLCAQPSARPRPGPSRSASERLPDKMRFRLSESNLPATVAEVGHDGSRNEQDRHLTHRASIAIGEKYPQQAYQQENQFHGMGPQDFQPQPPQFSASHQERMHHLAQQRQMAQNQRLQQMKNASNNNIDKDSPPPASLNRPLDPANVPPPDVVSPRLLERPLDLSDLPYHLSLCEIPSRMRKESGMPEAVFPPLAPLNCLSDPNVPPPHVVPPIVRKRPLDLSDLSYQLLLTEMQDKMRQKSGMRRPASDNERWFSDRPGWQDYWTELKKVEQKHREQHQERLVARQQQERLALQQTLEATFSPPAPLNRPLDPWNIPPPSLPQPDLLKRPVDLSDVSYQLMLMEVQNKKRIALGGPTRASNDDLRWWFSDQPGWQEYQTEIRRLLKQNEADPSRIPRSGVLPPDLLKRPLDLSDLCYQFKLTEMQNNSRIALGRPRRGSNDDNFWFSELPGWQEYWTELMRLNQENTERIAAMQDIQMPLELLEQQNRKRLEMARQEQLARENGALERQDYQMQLELLEQQNKKRLDMARQEHREELARENGASNPEERPAQPTSSSPSPSSYYTAGFDMKY